MVGVLLTFWLAYQMLPVILLLFAAIVLGIAIRPGVDWMRERGVLRQVGVIVIYTLMAVLLTGLLIILAPFIADQLTQFSQNLPGYYADLCNWLVSSGNQLVHNIGLRLPTRTASLMEAAQGEEEVLGSVTLTFLYSGAVLKAIFELLAVFLLAYYWTREGGLIMRTLLRIVPSAKRAGARDFLHAAEERIGGYIRGQALLCLIIGVAALAAYVAIGMPFSLVLAVIAGLTEMIPVVGPFLGAAPAVLVALSEAPDKVPWVIGALVAIQLLENAWLVPQVMRNSIGVNPILTILSLMAFGSVFGLLGALLALPSAAMIQLMIDRTLANTGQASAPPSTREADLGELREQSRETLSLAGSHAEQRSEDGTAAELQRITTDLEGVLARIEEQEAYR